jgi:hypothetical protein
MTDPPPVTERGAFRPDHLVRDDDLGKSTQGRSRIPHRDPRSGGGAGAQGTAAHLGSTGQDQGPTTGAPPGPLLAPLIPLHHPPLVPGSRPGPPMGEWVALNKSRPRRADAQRLVTTRLLDHLHDPLAQLGRLQRIHPRARRNDNPSARWGNFSAPPVADLFRYRARGLFVSDYDVRGKIIAFRHGF